MCVLYWQSDPRVSRRTQSSLAVSGDELSWVLLNCSPDIREQIGATAALHPQGSPRGSPVKAVVLTGGDIDNIGGLLSLREGTRFELYAPAPVLNMIAQNSIFNVLDEVLVPKHSLEEQKSELPGGLSMTAFRVPGKVPLYLESAASLETHGFTWGLRLIDAAGRSVAYVPSCASVDDRVRREIASADALFFDGTLWTDDELISTGTGKKTGRRMGHMPVSGPEGSIRALQDLDCGRRYFVHINNTNPLNREDSPERKAAEAAGWTIPSDGDEISL